MLYYLQLMVTSALEERSPHFCPTLPGKVSNFFYWSTWSHMLTDNWHYFTHDDYFILGMYSVILATRELVFLHNQLCGQDRLVLVGGREREPGTHCCSCEGKKKGKNFCGLVSIYITQSNGMKFRIFVEFQGQAVTFHLWHIQQPQW